MKKIFITTVVATLMSTAAFAQTEQHNALGGDNIDSGSTLNGSLNTNNNNYSNDTSTSSVTQTNSNNVGQSNNYNGTVVQNGNGTQKQIIDTNQVAPATLTNLTTSGVDTCHGSTTGGFTIPGIGAIGAGKTVMDENCEMIKNVKLLHMLGLQDGAICLMYETREDIRKVLQSVPTYAAIVEACDPKIRAKNEREAKLAEYAAAGLEAPAHLLGDSVIGGQPVAEQRDMQPGDSWVDQNGKRRWMNAEGKVCRNGKVLGVSTTICQ